MNTTQPAMHSTDFAYIHICFMIMSVSVYIATQIEPNVKGVTIGLMVANLLIVLVRQWFPIATPLALP